MSFVATTQSLSQSAYQRLAADDEVIIPVQLKILTLIMVSTRKAIALATAAQKIAKQLPIKATELVEQAAQEEASAIKGMAMIMDLAKSQLMVGKPMIAAAATHAAAGITTIVQEAACALVQAVQAVGAEQKDQKRAIKVLAKQAEQSVQKAEQIAKTDPYFARGLDVTSDAILTVSGAMLVATEDKNLQSYTRSSRNDSTSSKSNTDSSNGTC